MLNRRTQVVIAVGILILALAFFLVGLNFASLQGLFFQNGAASLQMFANDVGAAQNAIYSAPSSMSITLSGNTSLCQWVPAIDAYTCAGGSKIYNLSYAAGPTLDVGKNVFSFDLCVMLGILPFGSSYSEADEVSAAVSDTDEAFEEAATSRLVSAGAQQDIAEEEVQKLLATAKSEVDFSSLSTKQAARLGSSYAKNSPLYEQLLNSRTTELFASLDKLEDADYASGVLSGGIDSGTTLLGSVGSFVSNGIVAIAKNAARNVLLLGGSYLVGYASPYVYYWLSTDAHTASNLLSSATSSSLAPIDKFALLQSNSILSPKHTAVLAAVRKAVPANKPTGGSRGSPFPEGSPFKVTLDMKLFELELSVDGTLTPSSGVE